MAEKELIYKREQGQTQKLFYPIRKSKAFEACADYLVNSINPAFFSFLRLPRRSEKSA